ncbi:SDR family NAD(P)-dependent oxidoreductase [Kitasatospora sp. NPDC101157]|uniref:SDR family NAD(P)-dependent oxidoreductase n=1 Tax=Kitasatospora sp. NPDC101157 TaxID=3364098 RepID=UPI00382935A6
MTNSSPRTALVTGASRGIGRGIATRLAQHGWGLTVTARNADHLTELAGELRAAGAPHVARLAVDLAAEDAADQLAELHQHAFGAMSALVLNAGVGTVARAADFPAHRMAKTLQVNLVTSMRLTQRALPLLREGAAADPRHGASIIGLSSITGVHADAGYAVYGASKAALLRYLEAVHQEESAAGVRATSIAPAYVATDMTSWIADRVPAASMIPVEDVVEVVDMVLRLSRNAGVAPIVMTRAGTSGFQA